MYVRPIQQALLLQRHLAPPKLTGALAVFKTPLPNSALWNGQTIGSFSNAEFFDSGGWWHDSSILAATGEGLDKEEPRAWEGWWNEKVVELARLTIKQPDALCVLLTGRSEQGYAQLLKKMIAAKGLDFDIVGLKPQVSPTNQRFQNTMHFKQIFLDALMETYKDADEIRVYEDRPKHTAKFREFFSEFNRRQRASPTRGPIDAEVIQVADCSTNMDPVVEVAQVQHMINAHNDALARGSTRTRQKRLQIKKTVFFTSYMIGIEDSKKLFKLAQIPPEIPKHELRIHANNILICPRPCPSTLLEKVGGMGSRMLWEVTGTARYNKSVWAACVRPVPSTATYHTDNPAPLVILALRKGVRPAEAGKINDWQPLPSGQSFVFETTVGEKVMLRVEAEDPKEDEYESMFASKQAKRKHTADDDWAARTGHGQHGGRNESRGFHSSSRGGPPRSKGASAQSFRGSSHARSRGGGRGGGPRGKGSNHHYRSLDDVDPKGSHGGNMSQVSYDDAYPPLAQQPPTGPRAAAANGRGASQSGRGGGRGAGRGGQTASTVLQDYY